MLKIVLDAMGGDNAPYEIVKGAVLGIQQLEHMKVILVGDESKIKDILKDFTYDTERIEVVNASEIIDNHDAPVVAIRKKKDSSLVKGLTMLKDKQADAFISAGSTGALLAGGTLIVGRIPGIERPALAPLLPTKKGMTLLIDCGANVDSKASYLVQYATMGSIYLENVLGISNPKVALVNIGSEESKGNALVKETFPLLQQTNLNFTGNIEARDILYGDADVVVCDAFVGNVILKLTEGLSSLLIQEIKVGLMSNTISKLGALLIKKTLKKTLKKFLTSEYGGAPLLGVNGLVIKAHGNTDHKNIVACLVQSQKFYDQKINQKIQEKLGNEQDIKEGI
ncbi:MAG: plsX [Clostridiales bacterium]|jgi:glycerol-3-phosphate acyltransferase PlsX|nr:plsX [Clostridiales bacterium]